MTGPVWLSTAEYAKHRGCSDSIIRRYKRTGRLVQRDDGMIDRDASDAKLAATLNPLQGGDRTPGAAPRSAPQPPPAAVPPFLSSEPTVHEAVRRERLARARLAELELGEQAGDLTRRAEAHRAAFTLARQAMERMRAVGSRLRDVLAATTDPHICETLIDAEVEQICTDMQRAAAELAGQAHGHDQAAAA